MDCNSWEETPHYIPPPTDSKDITKINVNEDTDLSLHKGEGVNNKHIQINMNDPNDTTHNQIVEEFYIKTEEVNIEDVHWNRRDSTGCEKVTGFLKSNIKTEPIDYSDDEDFKQGDEGSDSSFAQVDLSSSTTEPGVAPEIKMEDVEAASDLNHIKKQSRKRTFECVDIKNESLDSPSSSSQRKSDDLLYKCKFCDNSFKSSNKLEKHVILCDENPNIPKELKVVKKEVDIEKMAFTVNGKKLYRCHYCTYITCGIISFKTHIQSHKRVENLFVCKFCNINLYNHIGLKKHCKQVHPGLKLYQCYFCSFSRQDKGNMIKHLRHHLSYYCDYCHFGTNSYPIMKRHLFGHKKRSDFYKCYKCIFTCSTTEALANHMEEHCETEQFCVAGEIDQVHDMHYSVGHMVKTEINEEDVAESEDVLTKVHDMHYSVGHMVKTEINEEDVAESEDVLTKQFDPLEDTGPIKDENHSENDTEVLAMCHMVKTEINEEDLVESEDVLTKKQFCLLEDTGRTEEEEELSENETEVPEKHVEEPSATEQLCILGEIDQVHDMHYSVGHMAETEINEEYVSEKEDVLTKKKSCSLEDIGLTEEEKHYENDGDGLEWYCDVEQPWKSGSSEITRESTSTPAEEDDHEEVQMAQSSKSYENLNDELGQSASFLTPVWSLWAEEPRISTDSLLTCRFCENPFVTEELLNVHELFCVYNRTAKAQNQSDMEKITVVCRERLYYLCQYCLFKTEKSNCFTVHMKKHLREGKLYFCRMCDLDLFNPYDMANHFQLSHPSQDPYQCPCCPFTTDNIFLIRRHWKIHCYYHCKFCAYRSNRLARFRFHQNSFRYRRFRCSYNKCNYGFCTREALENHKTEHQKIKSESKQECKFHEPDQNYKTSSSDSRTVEVFIKEEIVSDSEDSVLEGQSHVSHETSRSEGDRFSRSVELYDQVNSSRPERVEEGKKDELSKPLISNNEIFSSVVNSLDAHTTADAVRKVKNSELLQNVVNKNARPSASHDL